MKKYLKMILWILVLIGAVSVWNRNEAQAAGTQEYVTVRYYLENVDEGNRIGEEVVPYAGIGTVESAAQLQFDDEVLQLYHTQGKAAERYRPGRVVSYDKDQKVAAVVYEKVSYTVKFYRDEPTGTELGTLTMSGLVGDIISNRTLGKAVRNQYKPETGYLSGQLYQTAILSEDADSVEVQVVYHPVVMQSRIYFYNVCGSSDMGSDAILIESNGHFGLVDCGEDKDYPSGSDPRYPLRTDVVTQQYVDEQELIRFIAGKGVTELDFVILTHAHSDHMGAADEIMAAFDVDKVYAREYDDKYITDASRLWDNQYVYDNMVAAANRYGVTLIQDLDENNTAFSLEELQIQIKNYEIDYQADGVTREPKWDENENSLGVLVTDSYQNKVFLAGDIDNIDGDEDKLAQDPELANVTVLKLGHHGYNGSNTADYLNALNPKYAVVTNSRYRMDQETYERLVNRGTQIYFVMTCKEGITLDVPQITFTKEKEYSGWVFDSGLSKTYYYIDGEKLRDSQHEVDGKSYCFHEDGSLYDMEFYQDPKTGGWYYYGKGGVMIRNDWVLYKGEYYYMGADGKMLENQWVTSSGKEYYLDDNGRMLVSQWAEKNGAWFYLKEDGTRYTGTGWQQLDNRYYYLRADGSRMQSEWKAENGNWYYLDAQGVMASAQWALINGKWYYFQANGVITGGGWKEIQGRWYYFHDNGAMYENEWMLYHKNWYFLGADGAMVQSGWCNSGGNWYYFDGSGAMVTSKWVMVDGVWYYFGQNGVMYENQWLNYKKGWYYLNQDGGMLTSAWLARGGKWYYLKPDGVMAANTIIDGLYRVNKQGVWVN